MSSAKTCVFTFYSFTDSLAVSKIMFELVIRSTMCATLFFLYKKQFVRNLYPSQKKLLKNKKLLGFIQIFKKRFREILCIFDLETC